MIDLPGYGNQLAEGAVLTLEVAFTSLFFGMILGLLGAAGKLSRHRLIREPVTWVTNLLRGVPEFVILLICYFGLSNFLTEMSDGEMDITPFWGGVFALSIVFGAYSSEAFRGAFLAVHEGQLEAGRAYGMRPVQIFFRIHLPQAWRLVLPSLNNQWQNLLKDTSLVSVLGLEELLRKSTMAANETKQPFLYFLAAGATYMLFLGISIPVFWYLEKRANRGVRA